jgi:uncharacterized OB-fold protein
MATFPAARDERSAAFFDAAAAGRLVLPRCPECHGWASPYVFFTADARSCPTCHHDGLDWRDAGGRGVVVTWTAVHEKPTPDGVAELRRLVVVELDEGVWISGRYVGDPDALRIGAAVAVEFEKLGGGEPVPVFVEGE